ncbi:hypothetical protein A9Q99_12210 [Gammaproteobacteria bacterium 45_16_T64]|nr:hypothetical protein A9Q99_12210 [Gammaproteobacteria bacterium 45_16_T64]
MIGNQSSRGVTLIELVIAIVVMAVALEAMLSTFAGNVNRSADPMWRNKTIKISQIYLDEILSKRYDENTPIGGVPAATILSCSSLGPDTAETSSALYDDVDDYHGYSGVPTGTSGALDSSYSNYSVSITVTCDGSGASVVGSDNAKKITLVVTPPGQNAITFYAYRANY